MTKPAQPRTTDTLRQALGTLAALMDRTINEVNVLEAEIHDSIQQAMQHATESTRKEGEEHEKAAIEEAVKRTRTLVGDEFFDEMQRLTSEAAKANELLAQAKEEHERSLTETQDAAAIALERQVGRAVERVRAELNIEIAGLKSELERAGQLLAENKAEFHRAASEKESALKDVADKLRDDLEKAIATGERNKNLLAEAELRNSRALLEAQEAAESVDTAHKNALSDATARVRSELTEERDRLSRQLDELLHSAAKWDSEREQLQNEIKRGAAEKETALSAAKKEVAVSHSAATEQVKSEVTRVEESIQSISAIIDAPETELSIVIRKNVERAELEAYLRGIRFALSGK